MSESAWRSSYDFHAAVLGEDPPCDEETYRHRFDSQLCIRCGGERPSECAVCTERYRGLYASEGHHWRHGIECHACWDARRLKQPEGFEVPDYWPQDTYARPERLGAYRSCTFHTTRHGNWSEVCRFLVDELCPFCVAEDEEINE